jgi:hypothetical protein
MPESAYSDVTKLYSKALEKSVSGKGFAFDEEVKDFDELWNLHAKRSEIINSLKGKIGTSIKTRDWCPSMAQVDFLSRCERDLRLRFRSRVACFRKRSESHKLGLASIEAADRIISQNESE